MSLKTCFAADDVAELEDLRRHAQAACSPEGVISAFPALWVTSTDTPLVLPADPAARNPEELMDLVDGEESAWTYLCASIAGRELCELDVQGSSARWRQQRILTKDPWESTFTEEELERIWREPAPEEWRPMVMEDSQRVIVTFYTLDPNPAAAIHAHVDRFRAEGYGFRADQRVIARRR